MFYSQVILARKGPLGKIWLAAHFDKKLTKNQIFTTDISESVDSVLNPAAPLALRVSGHLMLGIVRIYSRKVKYLMADCTEAMWKIKLAFRPGNVDLADTQSATIAIDDPRFFGNIVPDQDYPELEDIAFSQNMLSNFVSLQAARGRTIASQQDTTQDSVSFHNFRNSTITESPMPVRKGQTTPLSNRSVGLLDMGYIPGEDLRGDMSVRSRLSEIELMRGEIRGDIGISGGNRPSLSTLRTSMSSGAGLAMRFDDDIPAFDDQLDDFGNIEAAPADYYPDNIDEMVPEHDADPYMEDNMNVDAQYQADEADVNQPNEEEKAGSPIDPSIEVPIRIPKVRTKKAQVNRAKKQRVAVDDSVELSSRAIKQPILRRRPGDALPPVPKSSKQLTVRGAVAVPPTARGLCPELQSLFAMTMTSADCGLPFPLKKGQVRQGSASGDRSRVKGLDSQQKGVNNRESLSIEAVRDYGNESTEKSRRASSLLLGNDEYNDFNDNDKGSFSPQQPMHDFGEEGAFDPQEQGNDFGGGYDDNMNMDEVAAPFSGSKYGRAELMEEMEDTRPGVGALKVREEDLMGERAATGPTNHEYRASDFSVRTAMVRDVLKDQLKEAETVSFQSISKGVSRRTAAACFLEVLQLRTWGYIDCEQDKPFSDINITATERLWQEEGGGSVMQI